MAYKRTVKCVNSFIVLGKQTVDDESDTPCLPLADSMSSREKPSKKCIHSESVPEPLSEAEPQPLNNLLDLLRSLVTLCLLDHLV